MDRLHAMTLGDVLREHRRSHPQKVALVCGDARISFPEFDTRVNRLANALTQVGFVGGDRLLWLGQNCHRVLEGLLACAKIGAVFCPVNWRQSPEELAFVLSDLSPKVVIWQNEEIGASVAKARELAKSGAEWWQHDGGDYEERLARASDRDLALDVDPSESVLLMYTAAFSGKPSGALLSHTAVMMQGLVTSKIKDIGPEYTYLNCGPLFHAATFMYTAATFLWAGENVFVRRMDAEQICQLIDREKCNGAFLVGPMLDKIIECNREGRYNLKSLRAPAASDRWNAMITVDQKKAGGYGQTEAGGLLTIASLGCRPSPFSQVRVVNMDGSDLPFGEAGEILARGPLMMNGYHNRPTETTAKKAGDWHHTGDLGRREEDGSLTFIGPMGRLIKSGFENVYPAEVEQCVKRHAAVADCAVLGIPDEKWQESVKAVVVLKPNQSATVDEIIEHCRNLIASYKKPRVVEFVDALPKKSGMTDYEAVHAKFGQPA